MPPIYEHCLKIPASAIDVHGHANNVEFIRWMQDAAVAHSNAVGCTAATTAAGAIWVARSHHIEYHRAAFLGEKIKVLTWVANFRRGFSLRKYKFIRESDGALLAKGETDWVFLHVGSGRPRSIPESIAAMFQLVSEDSEP